MPTSLPVPLPTTEEIKDEARKVRRNVVSRAVENVRRSVEKKKPAREGDEFKCRYCDVPSFQRAQGRARHESSAHPEEYAAAKEAQEEPPAGSLLCPHRKNGCNYFTTKPGWLQNHIDRDHGGRAG